MSISKKITILFSISFILLFIIGFWIDNINSKRIDDLMKDKYLKISNEILQNFNDKTKIEELLQKYNLEIEDKLDKDERTLYHQEHTFGFISIKREPLDNEFVLQINFLDDELILKSPDEKNIDEKLQLNLLILAVIILLFGTFLYTLKLLFPLKNITNKIDNFSKGDFTTRINIKSNDEIGILAKTFNEMAQTLEELIKRREELLRYIGHELRTPITKGKFAIEKIDDFSQKELLKKIFNDLEILTNDLIELEKLNSNSLEYSNFNAETLIVESLNKLFIEDEDSIKLEINENFKISGDLHYLCIALKNLIDNGLKYNTKLPLNIKVYKNKICISNYSKSLSKELEHYLKPFTQENSSQDGFGLGLSIVNKIIQKHNFKLTYKYEDEQSHFCINF